MKPYLLKIHRWITLAFAIPLTVVILSGLLLSIEPILQDRTLGGRSVSLDAVEAALQRHDPAGKANALTIRAWEGTLSLGRGGPRVAIGDAAEVPPDRVLWSDVLTTARRLHETLLLDLRWLVTASTVAMTVSMVLGVMMGLPFVRNTLGGWHRVTAWGLLPLLFLSTLTGLALSWGITFAAAPPAARGAPVALAEAVRIVARSHDLASVVWIRPQGGAMRARVYDGREARVFTVTRDGLVAQPRNWPRALHEGNWAGAVSGGLNVLVSLAFALLMATGLLIWGRRSWRRRRRGGLAAA